MFVFVNLISQLFMRWSLWYYAIRRKNVSSV